MHFYLYNFSINTAFKNQDHNQDIAYISNRVIAPYFMGFSRVEKQQIDTDISSLPQKTTLLKFSLLF